MCGRMIEDGVCRFVNGKFGRGLTQRRREAKGAKTDNAKKKAGKN
jgi:hypothetical protein